MIGVVAGAQLLACRINVWALFAARRFRVQQLRCGIPQAHEGAEFFRRALRYGKRLAGASYDGGECAVVVSEDRAVPQSGIGRLPGVELLLRLGTACCHQHAGFVGVGDDAGQCSLQRCRHEGQILGLHMQGVAAEHAGAHMQFAENVLRAGIEVSVDLDRLAVDLVRGDGLPQLRGRRLPGLPPAEHEEVGDDLGAGCAAVRAGRQTNSADKVGQVVHLAAGGRVLGIQRVMAAQHRNESAWPGEAQGLDDEVVVQRMVTGIVHGVMQFYLAKGDVADGGVEVAGGESGLGERLGADLCLRIQALCDGRGGLIQLDADHLSASRRHPDEGARTGSRLQHLAGFKSQLLQGRPDFAHEGGVGVVGVDRGASRLRVCTLRQKCFQLGAFVHPIVFGLIEHIRHGAPAGEAGEHVLLLSGR